MTVNDVTLGGYVDVGAESDVDDHGRIVAEVNGTPVLVVRGQRGLVAMVAECPHLGFPLDEAEIVGSILVCPQHGFRWDLRRGSAVPCWRGKSRRPLQLLPVDTRGGRVLVGTVRSGYGDSQ